MQENLENFKNEEITPQGTYSAKNCPTHILKSCISYCRSCYKACYFEAKFKGLGQKLPATLEPTAGFEGPVESFQI